ncbi:MAG: VOC family protein [bacterium]|jgi:predicted enzyme related to lactoylglutathione lyase
MKLHSILLYVPNVREVADWYAAHLGLEFIENQEDGKFAMLKSDSGSLLGIHYSPDAPASPGNIGLYFAVADVDAQYEKMRAAGCEFRQEPRDEPWGSRMATTRDPAGHWVGIESPVAKSVYNEH